MNIYIGIILLLSVLMAFYWTIKRSMEPFENMRPWFGYEPGIYGPGWGRTGCSKAPSCITASNNVA